MPNDGYVMEQFRQAYLEMLKEWGPRLDKLLFNGEKGTYEKQHLPHVALFNEDEWADWVRGTRAREGEGGKDGKGRRRCPNLQTDVASFRGLAGRRVRLAGVRVHAVL